MKIYLDTSVISALFDERNPERKSITEEFFQKSAGYQVYVSELTLLEIHRTLDVDLRAKMRDCVAPFKVLSIDDRVEELVNQYIHYDAVPQAYQEDAYHIAIATFYEMDYLLSWNFRHVVRRKTREIVQMVNALANMKPIIISTPAELL